MTRHTSSDKFRPDHHHTKQHCWACGMEKVTRHENEKHWTEFFKNGVKLTAGATPVCEGRIELNREAAA